MAMEAAAISFRERIQRGPTYVCTVCHRALFPNQVKRCHRGNYLKNQDVVALCLTAKYVHACNDDCSTPCTVPVERVQEWICYCCDSHLKTGRLPPIAVANKLALAPIPPELVELNVLERQLIAKILPFAKIVALPKGRQRAVHGVVVCVPAEMEATVNSLPRSSIEDQLLQVKLKRNLKYKGHQHFFTVNMKNVISGLRKLKERHPEYYNVTINEDATFESPPDDQEVAEEEPGTSEQQPSVGQEVLRPGLALDTCMQPPDIAQEVLSYGEGIFSVAPAQANKPVGFFSIPNLESMAYPVQFPNGQNTMDEVREIKLSPSRYFNARLFCVDTRFASDQSYLFFAQFVTEIHMATNSMSIQLRMGKPFTKGGRRISNQMLQDKEEVERLIRNKDATRFMQPLRGTPAYWHKQLRDLHAMCRQLGKATWFITLSAAEMRWPEVIQAIKAQQGEEVDFSELDWNTKCEILRSNPVTVMRLFEKRVDAIIDVITSPAQPIGQVQDYFYRVEFQARGSPHIHMMVWIKDAPECDDPEDTSEAIRFIDRYVNCQMPDQKEDPELHKIVSDVQVHSRNHSKSCKKGNVTCRFGFPKLPMDETMITVPCPEPGRDEDEGQKEGRPTKARGRHSRSNLTEHQREAKKKLAPVRDLLNDPNASFTDLADLLQRCKLTKEAYLQYVGELTTGIVIHHKREPSDCRVNSYNPDLLRIWDANMDIQFILDDFTCSQYILGYVAKPEHEMSEMLQAVVSDIREKKVGGQKPSVGELDEMRQIMNVYSKHREVSAQESVARVCSLPLKKCTRAVTYIQTDENPLKMSHPMSRLMGMDSDREDIWMSGFPEKYAQRPQTTEFRKMCLAEFVSEYRVVYGQQTKGPNVIPLLNDMGFIQKRNHKPAVIRFTRFSDQKQPEKFYRRMLKLYLPHRVDDELKSETHPTYEEFYKEAHYRADLCNFSVKDIVDFNMKRYEGKGKEIEKALEKYREQGPGVDAWNSFAPEVDSLECAAQRKAIDSDEEQDQVPEYQVGGQSSGAVATVQAPKLSPSYIRSMYRSLNETQASIFYTVREWCLRRVWGCGPEPFFHFLSGGAGCGKSHVIKCVYQEASSILRQLPTFRNDADMSQSTVLLTAFTGTAAFNIAGKTLHSILRLPRSLKPPYQPLGNTLDELRAVLANTEILIIDEISMVSKELFAYVHWRFQQIKGNKKPFGGISVLAVGDFYQLPPVGRAKPLCIPGAVEVVDLWIDFQMVNLTEIMRQKDDRAFAELLNRLRAKKKTESLCDGDMALLTRAVADVNDCPPDALRIFATNKEVDEHNAVIVSTLQSQIHEIPANDSRKDPRTGILNALPGFSGNKRELADRIKVGVGARVMVIRNLDVEDGIVNGTFGTVADIVISSAATVDFIGLELDNPTAGQNFRKKIRGPTDNLVYIERFEENMSRRGVVRRQFPLRLAFGCTAHKVQGMTMKSAVVSLKRIFEPGMAYVALSRTTSLQGLHITDFEEKKIYADPDITTAMENMAQLSFQKTRPLLHFANSVAHNGPMLTIIHHNTEGLASHVWDMKAHHEFRHADVLCLTETHLSGSSVPPELQLEGYNIEARSRHLSYSTRKDMATKEGGGVAVYYRSSLQAEPRRYVYNVTDLEFALVKVESPVKALIATVYRPPQFSLDMFLPNMERLLESLRMLDCGPVVVCGDFNEDLLSKGKKAIRDMFQSKGYTQLISTATTQKQTLIDHIYISQPGCCLQSGVLQTYYSYHDAVYCVLSLSAVGSLC